MSRPERGPGEPPVSIVVCEGGPLLVHGEVEVLDEDGQRLEVRSPMVLCRCGRSGAKPFCDATHKVGKPT